MNTTPNPCHSLGENETMPRISGLDPISQKQVEYALRESIAEIQARNQELRERERQLSAFSRLGQKLSAAETERHAAELIAEVADELLAWDACSLSLYLPAEGKLRDLITIDTIDGRRATLDRECPERAPSPLALRVMAEGGQLILKEEPGEMVQGGEPFGDTARPSASILAVPVSDGAHAAGIFTVQSYTSHAYTAAELRLLQTLADYCGGAFKRIRAQIAEREARILLEKAQEVARLGSWSSWIGPNQPLTWSSEVYRIFGVSAAEFTGKVQDFYARVHPEDRELVRTASRLALEQGLPYDLDHRILRPDGTVAWVHEKAELLRDTEGRPIRMVGVVQDITERKRTEEALRNSEQRWRTLFECSPDACYLNDLKGQFIAGNRAAEQMVGYQREELIGKNFFEAGLLDEAGCARVAELVALSAKGQATGPDKINLRRKDGCWIVAEIRSFPIQFEDQVVVLGVARDITEHTRAEASLRASEERYRMLFESVNDGIFLRPVSEDGTEANFIEVNSVACKRLGYSRAELLCKSPRDIDPLTDLKQVRSRARLLRDGEGYLFETVHVAKDGGRIPVEINAHFLEWGGKRMLLSVVRDLRERKAAEGLLRESERRFREMLENVRLFSVMMDEMGRILFINSFLLRTTGYDAEEVIGRNWFELFIPDHESKRVEQVFATLMQGADLCYFENEILTRNGERRLVAWNNTILRSALGAIIGVTSIGEDITQRKAAEMALKASEEQFRATVENGPIGIFVQTEGRFAYVNALAASLFGASSAAELGGLSVLERFHPDVRPQVQERIGLLNHERQPVPTKEEKCLRLDGACFDAEFTAVPFVYQGKNGALVFFQDITERKRLERQLRQAQKMEAVGQLAGGVAHDFNNILSAVLMNLGLLRHRHSLPAEAVESLDELEKETLRATSLTRQLLMFSRQDAAEIKPIDLNAVLPNAVKMLRRLLGEHIDLVFQPNCDRAMIAADVGMIEQVVMNLCINARDAMPKGGRVVLATEVVELSAESLADGSQARAGRFARLSVADTGCGMDDAVRARIFEPFFTTKEAGKGTGLGLATVYGIVKQHQGWIEVESQQGKGSTFRVHFPELAGPVGMITSPNHAEMVKEGTESILLVEDELSVRRIAALCLRKLGYAVHEASNGTQALEVWREHGRHISLLLTDMVLPEASNGLELAETLWREKPGLRVIITSGYNPDTSGVCEDPQRPITFLAKPFKATTLANVVRECLDGRPG